MIQIKAKLIKNIEVAPNYYKMVLDAPAIACAAKPGQFVNILAGDKFEPLLRRPFSIYNVNDSKLEILYRVVGKATELFSKKKPGEKLNVLGPLGNGFDLKTKKAKILLVGGGIGIAPLVFLAEKLTGKEILALIGAKNKKHILCVDELKDAGAQVKIATDDGGIGFKGSVTDLLKQSVRPKDKIGVIFACGPKPMLKEVAYIAKKHKIEARLSLEEHMACGIGACFGCVVNTTRGYKRVCKEGPVFDAREVIF
ncbi:MAG: dihydroorotate dehydrogenase electron transfer subunit [Candidatus Omnitrophica bacterium]|nr:dihydroorotate dehydrogenase electron transfer subunit [Candidatus Omnitrophota bacterium]HOX54073.1 dihydroorotate dehydrogenase electron transfer subunit [Candidatus Omnitrophota bacterium]